MKNGWITIGEDDSARHVFLWNGKIYGGESAFKISQKHSFDKSKTEYKNGKLHRKTEEEDGSKAEREAVEEYVSGNGMWINQYLRGRGDFGELTENEKKFLNDLTKATDKPLKPQTLYRSVDAEAIFGKMSEGDYENLTDYLVYGKDTFGKGVYADRLRESMQKLIDGAEGKYIPEKGFMSTTKDYLVAYDWGDYTGSSKPIVLEIDVGEGAKGIDVSWTDANADEEEAQQEVLLARGQTLAVDSIGDRDGVIYVKCSLKSGEAEKPAKTVTADGIGLKGRPSQSKAMNTKINNNAQKIADFINSSKDNELVELYTNADLKRLVKFSKNDNWASSFQVSLVDMSKRNDIGGMQTNIHELAHVIDRNAGGIGHFTNRYINQFEEIAEKYKRPQGEMKEYLEGVQKEYANIRDRLYENIKEKQELAMQKLNDDVGNAYKYMKEYETIHNSYVDDLRKEQRNLGNAGLEDIYSAMNDGGREDGLYTYAHSEKYYSLRENKVIETFANYCAMRATKGKAYEMFKKHLPEMNTLMETIVKDILNRRRAYV